MASTTNERSIPDDVAFDILSRLPVKSVKRFGCVCKSWSDLFESPNFMTMYRKIFLSKYDNDDDSCLLLTHSMPNAHEYEPFLLSGEKFEDRVKLDWPSPFDERHVNIFVLGPGFEGTLCLYQDAFSGPRSHLTLKVVLWNPTTEEFQLIPPGTVECPRGVDIQVDLQGFGYDPVTHDYKIIRDICFFIDSQYFWANHKEDFPDPFPEPLLQIYSQRSNSWRILDVSIPHLNSEYRDAVYLNGVCHWWGAFYEEEALVSFNLSNEVFHTTSLVYPAHALYLRQLVVLNGSIAMITMYEGTSFDISILGEVGVKESWTKLFSVGPLPFVGRSIGVGKKGCIFFHKNDKELVCFDLSTQMIKDTAVNEDGNYFQVVTYKESHLPIGVEE